MFFRRKETEQTLERSTSLGRDAWLRLRKNRVATISIGILAVIFAMCFIGAWFMADPDEQEITQQFLPPSGDHWFGTEQLGRDLFSRVFYGGQISLLVGLVATAVSLVIGIAYGATAGYLGGRVDSIMMRLVDTLYAIPFLVLVIVLQVVLADQAKETGAWIVDSWGWDKRLVTRMTNIIPLILALSALGWLTLARIIRAQVMALKHQEFVEAAVSLGLSRFRIVFSHILPNTIGPAIVYTTLTIPGFILTEAGLSYLGLGIEAPNSSWGVLIKEGANYVETQPLLLLIPSFFFVITLYALNSLGDGLRDALDVKSSKD